MVFISMWKFKYEGGGIESRLNEFVDEAWQMDNTENKKKKLTSEDVGWSHFNTVYWQETWECLGIPKINLLNHS